MDQYWLHCAAALPWRQNYQFCWWSLLHCLSLQYLRASQITFQNNYPCFTDGEVSYIEAYLNHILVGSQVKYFFSRYLTSYSHPTPLYCPQDQLQSQPFCKSGSTVWNHNRLRTSRLYKMRVTKLVLWAASCFVYGTMRQQLFGVSATSEILQAYAIRLPVGMLFWPIQHY